MRVALVLLGVMLVSPAAFAEDAPAPSADAGRYTMTPAPNGFLRLDTRTGAVSLCTVSGTSAECRAAADDRAALTAEVERLVKKNNELEARLGDGGTTAKPRSVLPDRQEMNKAFDYAEEFMRRMMRLMREDSSARDRI